MRFDGDQPENGTAPEPGTLALLGLGLAGLAATRRRKEQLATLAHKPRFGGASLFLPADCGV